MNESMSAGKSQEAAAVNTPGCLRIRSCAPSPDFEKPSSQFCSLPVLPRFLVTQGTRSSAMKVSYWIAGLVGLFAYQGSTGNDGSTIVRLYLFCALSWRSV